MLGKVFKYLMLSVFCGSLMACATFKHQSGLTSKQVKMLQSEGFSYSEVEGWNLPLPGQILFDHDSFDVKSEIKQDLIRLSSNLQKYKLENLRIIGHTDNQGTEQYNQELSEQRAQSVAKVLTDQGLSNKNLTIIGRGMAQPLVDNDTEENRAINRRVVIIIVP